MIWHAGGLQVGAQQPAVACRRLRVGIGFGSMFGFFYVFPRMPLVDAYAISFAAPSFMVALSVPILGEPVGWRRWTAVGVGFAGVLIMLDPWGIEFHVVSLVILAATFCYALSTVMVRLLQPARSRRRHPLLVRRSCASVVLAGRRHPRMEVAAAARLGLADHPGPAGRRRADPDHPAPGGWPRPPCWRPSTTPRSCWPSLFGYLWFKEEPSWTVWYGLPLVIGSGLYILHRERVRAASGQGRVVLT